MTSEMPPDPDPRKPGELGDRLKELVAMASDPKPGHYLHGILVISFWAEQGKDEPATCDFLSTPVEQTAAQLRVTAIMTREIVEKMDGAS